MVFHLKMTANRVINKLLAFAFAIALPLTAHAELKLPGIISDHMMLQQKIMNRIWGWDTPETKVTVNFTGQKKSTEAGKNGRWEIHPKNKNDVAARLARWALVNDYGQTFSYRSPEFSSMAIMGNRAIITFEMFGGKLRPFEVGQPRGFTICGDDQIWHNATGRILGDDRIAVWSEKIPKPIAVRYAWADNPVCNLFNDRGLPMTPFRTDDFELITTPNLRPE